MNINELQKFMVVGSRYQVYVVEQGEYAAMLLLDSHRLITEESNETLSANSSTPQEDHDL